MSTITTTRRRQLRYSLTGNRACLEFEYPSPKGRQYRLTLTDMSASGVSFSLDREEAPLLEAGTTVSSALVRVGDCMIRGDLLIMHMTPDSETTLVCGALLYPESDSDLIKLKSVIAGMEIAGVKK